MINQKSVLIEIPSKGSEYLEGLLFCVFRVLRGPLNFSLKQIVIFAVFYKIPKEQLQLEITAYLVNQELVVPVRYWKGAVRIVGSSNGKDIHGHGYIELTDYSVTN